MSCSLHSRRVIHILFILCVIIVHISTHIQIISGDRDIKKYIPKSLLLYTCISVYCTICLTVLQSYVFFIMYCAAVYSCSCTVFVCESVPHVECVCFLI